MRGKNEAGHLRLRGRMDIGDNVLATQTRQPPTELRRIGRIGLSDNRPIS